MDMQDMDLRKWLDGYCDRAAFLAGERFWKNNKLSQITREKLADSKVRICAKTVDGFNFVNHPALILDEKEEKLLEFSCDCRRPAEKSAVPCEHCIALALSVDLSVDPERQEMAAAPVQPPRSMEILLGHRMEDGEPLVWRPNDTSQVFHTNMGIIGTMGTGKTQFTKAVVTQLYRQQPDNYDGSRLGVLIFDYKGDYNETKADFVQAVHARVLKPYRLPYNPLALYRTEAFRPLLPVHTANGFKDTISRIFRLGPKQQQFLFDCILKAYAAQGIRPDEPETWRRLAPTFDQVYRIYEKETSGKMADSLAAAMGKLWQFRLFEDRPSAASPLSAVLNGITVIDLSGFDSDIQNLIVAITLDQIYSWMHASGSSRTDGRYRQLRSLILVDEADSIMDQGFPSLRKIMKEGREFGVGVMLSTQSLSHFAGDDEDYSRYVLTWVVHNVSDLKQREAEYVFKLPPKSAEGAGLCAAIRRLGKHESVVRLSQEEPERIRDRAFWQLLGEESSLEEQDTKGEGRTK